MEYAEFLLKILKVDAILGSGQQGFHFLTGIFLQRLQALAIYLHQKDSISRCLD